MDKHFRQQAQRAKALAIQYEHSWKCNNNTLVEKLQISLIWYEKIKIKNDNDYREMADACWRIAIVYFNAKNYILSIENYTLCIQNRLKTSFLTDGDYRHIIKRYIDLSDAFLHLHDMPAALLAIENAMKAFSLIKCKTHKESGINNTVDDFVAFHRHFEEATSTPNYMQSTLFKNHQQLLQDYQTERNLISKINELSIVTKPLEDELTEMLAKLSMTDISSYPVFAPIAVNQITPDYQHRSFAMDYLRLTKMHLSNQQLNETRTTYQQALDALQLIVNKTESDWQTIELIPIHLRKLEDSNYQPQENFVMELEM